MLDGLTVDALSGYSKRYPKVQPMFKMAVER
jgi:hypothetical protein